MITEETKKELVELVDKTSMQIEQYRNSGGLTQTFMNKTFPSALTEAITEYGTYSVISKDTDLPEPGSNPSEKYASQLGNTLVDPLTKVCLNIPATIEGMEDEEPWCDDSDLLEVVNQGVSCLNDIFHNFPDLAGKNAPLPETTQMLLDTYGELLDKLTEIKTTLEEQGVTPPPQNDPENEFEYCKGMDHLKPMPKEILALC